MKNLLLIFLLLIPIAYSSPIDFNVVKYEIKENKVDFKNELRFHLLDIEIDLPANYDSLSIKINGGNINYSVEDNKIRLNLKKDAKILEFQYSTIDYLKENEFLTEFKSQLFSSFLFLEVKIPKDAEVDFSYLEDNYFPPKEVITEEDYKLIRWQKEDVQKGDVTFLYLKYKNFNEYLYFILPLLTIITILIFILWNYSRKLNLRK